MDDAENGKLVLVGYLLTKMFELHEINENACWISGING